MTKKNYIIAVIPARDGSKSIKDKNIKLLDSHPLIAYSIVLSKIVTKIDRVIVSTNSKKYAKISKSYGAEVPFLRPDKISGDKNTDIEFFKHCINWMKKNEKKVPDLIVHLRPTTPLREPKVVNDAINFMLKNTSFTSLRSANKTHLTPYKMFKSKNGVMTPFMNHRKKEFYNLPRQAFEEAYIPNGYVDIIRPDVIIESKTLHGNKMKLWETPEVPDIDVQKDYIFAENMILENKFSNLNIDTYLKESF